MPHCREKLLKSIQTVHLAILAYADCICDESSEEDQEIFFMFGTELSLQLKELRKLYLSLYQVDPLGGYPTFQLTCDMKSYEGRSENGNRYF